MKRWSPQREVTRREKLILKRVKKIRKLFTFLRLYRHEIFDDEFQEELEGMYRNTGAAEEPVPPALLCMASLLQGYLGISDAEMVELTVIDLRVQMVLGCLGAEEPAFAQGTLQQHRERLIRADMDRRLLERTREVAKKTKGFDWKKLPKDLRVGIDSRPLLGAGRVEDTFNLLGHAARKLVECMASTMGRKYEDVCRIAGIPLLSYPSIKTGLDVNWNDPEQRDVALQEGAVLDDVLQPYIEAVAQVHEQDIEEARDGRAHLRQGVAPDRRVSIEDAEMRHGRKSKSKRFNGYKEHVAADLDSDLILACAVTPANRPEEEATPQLQEDMDHQGIRIGEAYLDRAYINSEMVEEVEANGGEVICKPWSGKNSRATMFNKTDFKIDLRANRRGRATPATASQTPEESQGQSTATERTGIEHRLAHVAARKGPKARYRGVRNNLFDLRRAAAIQNLETIQRKAAA